MTDANAAKLDAFEKELEETPDVCMDSLKTNWDGILAGAILECI
jgi:hypothetical protein